MYGVHHVQVFFCEDILGLKWAFFIHYDPRLRHVFEDSSMDNEEKNDSQWNEREVLENIEEIEIHDDVEDGYVQAQEGNIPNLDDFVEDNNMDGTKNDDPNTSGNNTDGLESSFNDNEDDESEDEDDENTTLAGWCNKNNIKYLK